MKRPYFQKWHMQKGDRFLGARIVKYNHEDSLTIDLYWWWGGVMIWFGKWQSPKRINK